jgi:hypothetical protein
MAFQKPWFAGANQGCTHLSVSPKLAPDVFRRKFRVPKNVCVRLVVCWHELLPNEFWNMPGTFAAASASFKYPKNFQ